MDGQTDGSNWLVGGWMNGWFHPLRNPIECLGTVQYRCPFSIDPRHHSQEVVSLPVIERSGIKAETELGAFDWTRTLQTLCSYTVLGLPQFLWYAFLVFVRVILLRSQPVQGDNLKHTFSFTLDCCRAIFWRFVSLCCLINQITQIFPTVKLLSSGTVTVLILSQSHRNDNECIGTMSLFIEYRGVRCSAVFGARGQTHSGHTVCNDQTHFTDLLSIITTTN